MRHNLTASSAFTRYPRNLITDEELGNRITLLSRIINLIMAGGHGAAILCLLVLSLARLEARQRRTLLFLACLVYSVILLSIFTYWQGDRLILAALPAWAVLYPLIVWNLLHLRRHSGSAQLQN